MTVDFDPQWKFERYRPYITYERMQQAAAVLKLHEGTELDKNNPEMDVVREDFRNRTGLTWAPDREGSGDIVFNTEGTFYRNKGRLLSSFFIIKPKHIQTGKHTIQVTEFGEALARGGLSEEDFFREIVQRYEYPHPAFRRNWDAWSKADRRLKPFIYILQILVELYKQGDGPAFVKTEDLTKYAYPESDHNAVKEVAAKIMAQEELPEDKDHPEDRFRGEIDRNVREMCVFLCMAGYLFMDRSSLSSYSYGMSYGLNLMGVHPEEETHFWEKRPGNRNYDEANRLDEIDTLIENALNDL